MLVSVGVHLLQVYRWDSTQVIADSMAVEAKRAKPLRHPDRFLQQCFTYLVCYIYCSVSCCTFTDDSSMLAAGMEDSQIRVWTLSQNKLRAMKGVDELNMLDKEAGE